MIIQSCVLLCINDVLFSILNILMKAEEVITKSANIVNAILQKDNFNTSMNISIGKIGTKCIYLNT